MSIQTRPRALRNDAAHPARIGLFGQRQLSQAHVARHLAAHEALAWGAPGGDLVVLVTAERAREAGIRVPRAAFARAFCRACGRWSPHGPCVSCAPPTRACQAPRRDRRAEARAAAKKRGRARRAGK